MTDDEVKALPISQSVSHPNAVTQGETCPTA